MTAAPAAGYVPLNERPHGGHAKPLGLVGEGKRVLDIGCSSGYLARLLAQRGCIVVGIEEDLAAAEQAAGGPVGDAEKMELPFEPASFHVLLCGDLVERLRDPERFLTRIRPYLRPHGRLVLTTPDVANWANRPGLHAGRGRLRPSLFAYQFVVSAAPA